MPSGTSSTFAARSTSQTARIDLPAPLVLHGEMTAVGAEPEEDGAEAVARQYGPARRPLRAPDQDRAVGRAAGDPARDRVEVDAEIPVLGTPRPGSQGTEVGQGQAGDRLVAELQAAAPRGVQAHGLADRPQALETVGRRTGSGGWRGPGRRRSRAACSARRSSARSARRRWKSVSACSRRRRRSAAAITTTTRASIPARAVPRVAEPGLRRAQRVRRSVEPTRRATDRPVLEEAARGPRPGRPRSRSGAPRPSRSPCGRSSPGRAAPPG